MMMRFSTILGASLALVLASACGDDGGNNNGSCGDGHVTGSETCDDGNTASGDGCSSSCKMESGKCGDNTVDVATEQCDDGNMASGDGCSATCQNEGSAMCGNGAINGTEACDDGNMASNDGCSSTCIVESGYTCTGTPSVCTMGGGGGGTCAMPFNVVLTGTTTQTATLAGDTTTSTSQVGEAECDGFGPEGVGNDHIYKFTTTGVRDVKLEFNTTNTAFVALMRLMTTPCDLTTEIKEYTGAADGCSDIDGSGFLGYVNLAAGTYYVVVDSYDAAELGAYEITLTATAPGCGNGMSDPAFEFCDDGNTANGDGCNSNCEVETGYTCTASATAASVCQMLGCGDGIVQTGETCDDDNTATGDGCDATCHVETGWNCNGASPTVCVMVGCGNGLIEGTEECDDGNLTSGDRCSMGCILESDVTDTEPNDTTPQALTAGNHIIRGQFSSTDTDLYTFTLATAQTVEIETYFTINGTTADYGGVGSNPKFDCTTADDTLVGVFAAGVDVTMDALALALDSDDGDSYCSYVGPADSDGDTTQLMNLPAGTYTIRVGADPFTTGITARRYMLDLKIGGSAMTPVAPSPGDIKINEFLAADGPAGTGTDSNCDGSFTNTDDEFIEFVNVSGKTLDLTGLTIKDGGAPTAVPPVPPVLQFTFAPAATGSMTLLPGKAVVVWAGGAPVCPGVTNWFTAPATQHTLSLNDAGDSITLATGGATPVTIATTTYPAQTVGTSSNLSPDVTGTTYALHTVLNAAVKASPGKRADGTAF